MKTSQRAANTAAILAMCFLVSTNCDARRRHYGGGGGSGGSGSSGSSGSSSGDASSGTGDSSTETTFPAEPSGWITAFPSIVQTGTNPTLSWGINHPSIVEDYVTITPPSTVTTDVEIDCEIRVLGAGVTVSSSNSSSFSFVPTEARLSYDNGSYERIFYGTNHDVNPNQVVWSRTIPADTNLKFGGRYYYSHSWGPWFNTDSGTLNVRTLVNGDIPPDNVPDYNAPSLESFLQPYLSSSGRVAIGPMDVIVFMELTHTDSQMNNVGYDLQDMVLLVTFKSRATTNNSGGNNLDGVDSETPEDTPYINLDTDPETGD